VRLGLRLRRHQTMQRQRRLLRGRDRDLPGDVSVLGGVSNVLGDVCTMASAEDWYPILEPVNDQFARGNHVLEEELEEG
jgi:hypothetical protein